ncbi:hypothetical protein HYH03_017844 [Edaphochlamys debaryana]|uniref:Uncharacterized protein n=1 Tax=Edaphochlamys debaryana TaxID=47281 RepID=A0A836BNX6_9CHLO|nr:hypothetical protein HYH03_017844 [Edaphochlamys debaryana]|eukprot:KAG2483297.1 hypothetical protein HYH03_017844 [Edaphochlamys debaryana]
MAISFFRAVADTRRALRAAVEDLADAQEIRAELAPAQERIRAAWNDRSRYLPPGALEQAGDGDLTVTEVDLVGRHVGLVLLRPGIVRDPASMLAATLGSPGLVDPDPSATSPVLFDVRRSNPHGRLLADTPVHCVAVLARGTDEPPIPSTLLRSRAPPVSQGLGWLNVDMERSFVFAILDPYVDAQRMTHLPGVALYVDHEGAFVHHEIVALSGGAAALLGTLVSVRDSLDRSRLITPVPAGLLDVLLIGARAARNLSDIRADRPFDAPQRAVLAGVWQPPANLFPPAPAANPPPGPGAAVAIGPTEPTAPEHAQQPWTRAPQPARPASAPVSRGGRGGGRTPGARRPAGGKSAGSTPRHGPATTAKRSRTESVDDDGGASALGPTDTQGDAKRRRTSKPSSKFQMPCLRMPVATAADVRTHLEASLSDVAAAVASLPADGQPVQPAMVPAFSEKDARTFRVLSYPGRLFDYTELTMVDMESCCAQLHFLQQQLDTPAIAGLPLPGGTFRTMGDAAAAIAKQLKTENMLCIAWTTRAEEAEWAAAKSFADADPQQSPEDAAYATNRRMGMVNVGTNTRIFARLLADACPLPASREFVKQHTQLFGQTTIARLPVASAFSAAGRCGCLMSIVPPYVGIGLELPSGRDPAHVRPWDGYRGGEDADIGFVEADRRDKERETARKAGRSTKAAIPPPEEPPGPADKHRVLCLCGFCMDRTYANGDMFSVANTHDFSVLHSCTSEQRFQNAQFVLPIPEGAAAMRDLYGSDEGAAAAESDAAAAAETGGLMAIDGAAAAQTAPTAARSAATAAGRGNTSGVDSAAAEAPTATPSAPGPPQHGPRPPLPPPPPTQPPPPPPQPPAPPSPVVMDTDAGAVSGAGTGTGAGASAGPSTGTGPSTSAVATAAAAPTGAESAAVPARALVCAAAVSTKRQQELAPFFVPARPAVIPAALYDASSSACSAAFHAAQRAHGSGSGRDPPSAWVGVALAGLLRLVCAPVLAGALGDSVGDGPAGPYVKRMHDEPDGVPFAVQLLLVAAGYFDVGSGKSPPGWAPLVPQLRALLRALTAAGWPLMAVAPKPKAAASGAAAAGERGANPRRRPLAPRAAAGKGQARRRGAERAAATQAEINLADESSEGSSEGGGANEDGVVDEEEDEEEEGEEYEEDDEE